jgi:hypothetical protein
VAGPKEDEGLHPAGADADWQESVYLAWFDPVVGLGGNHRIGNEINRQRSNLWCGVYHRGGSRFRHNGQDLPFVMLDEPGLQAGPQRLYHDGQALRFRLEAEKCNLDLVIEDEEHTFERSQPTTFAGGNGSAGVIFSKNFHVFCRVRGSVTLGDREAVIDARGWRDHSWGVRRWDSFLSSRSFAGSFGSEVQFRYASMVGANGTFFRHGALVRGGRRDPVSDVQMLVSLDDDSVRCPAAEVRYGLEGGEKVTVRIETIGGMLGVTGSRAGWESVGDVWLDGEPGGWGFLEVNNNPRNGSDLPAFVLADGLTNGLVVADP